MLPLLVPDDFVVGGTSVDFDIKHEHFPDLVASLTSPSGTSVGGFKIPPGGLEFDPNNPPTFLGHYYVPGGGIGTLAFNGERSRGLWTLSVEDVSIRDAGYFGGWTLNLAPAPVPEPTTVLLFGSGLVGLRWVVRRRKDPPQPTHPHEVAAEGGGSLT